MITHGPHFAVVDLLVLTTDTPKPLPDTTDQEVRELFEQYGVVRLMTVPKKTETGKARGFSFVDMATPEECQTCIDALDGTTFRGRVIKVNQSVSKDSVVPTPSTRRDELAPGCKKLYVAAFAQFWSCLSFSTVIDSDSMSPF